MLNLNQISSIAFIFLGAMLILFRKKCVQFYMKNSSRPKILKHLEQKIKSDIKWPDDLPKEHSKILEVICLVFGILFLILGTLAISGVIKYRP